MDTLIFTLDIDGLILMEYVKWRLDILLEILCIYTILVLIIEMQMKSSAHFIWSLWLGLCDYIRPQVQPIRIRA